MPTPLLNADRCARLVQSCGVLVPVRHELRWLQSAVWTASLDDGFRSLRTAQQAADSGAHLEALHGQPGWAKFRLELMWQLEAPSRESFFGLPREVRRSLR
ncbi:hypothetical protein PAL_GLEAN10013308 [Pteropus alecto]|uniref:Uncharacterized protein n=1 Tax=Pteropus alecto TaxID=9402 RepID=L5KF89_PTEAL|nr:hypothetical protein PAL_GLEAN10013308 [Pteropus alecto]